MKGHIRSEDVHAIAMASYMRGQHDILETLVEVINRAQEFEEMPAPLAQYVREICNGMIAALPPKPERVAKW